MKVMSTRASLRSERFPANAPSWLYGMRTAAQNWENEYSGTLVRTDSRWERRIGVPSIKKVVVFESLYMGATFVVSGKVEELNWFENMLRERYH